jgi:hypothetical protein
MSNSLSDGQWTFLEDLMNAVIPESKHMPKASSIVTPYIKNQLTSSPHFENILKLLETTETAARTKNRKGFSDLTEDEKETLLRSVEANDQNMFLEFVNLVYNGYYTSRKVVELLGPDAGVPQPKGFFNPPFNPNIVDRVRTLGTNYRAI